MARFRPSAAITTLSALTGLALVALSILAFPSAGAAEEFEATHCLGGTWTAFQGSQELKFVYKWAHNGILRSPNKLFNNIATHFAGVMRGAGPTREGYTLFKMVDADGDIIIGGGPIAGLKLRFPFLEGTGKWKGITGDFESERVAFGPKPALPDSYHECYQWKGRFEVRK